MLRCAHNCKQFLIAEREREKDKNRNAPIATVTQLHAQITTVVPNSSLSLSLSQNADSFHLYDVLCACNTCWKISNVFSYHIWDGDGNGLYQFVLCQKFYEIISWNWKLVRSKYMQRETCSHEDFCPKITSKSLKNRAVYMWQTHVDSHFAMSRKFG